MGVILITILITVKSRKILISMKLIVSVYIIYILVIKCIVYISHIKERVQLNVIVLSMI